MLQLWVEAAGWTLLNGVEAVVRASPGTIILFDRHWQVQVETLSLVNCDMLSTLRRVGARCGGLHFALRKWGLSTLDGRPMWAFGINPPVHGFEDSMEDRPVWYTLDVTAHWEVFFRGLLVARRALVASIET